MATAMVVAMEAMDMVATVVDTVDTEDTMARGMLMPLLRLPLMPSLVMATMAVDMDTERGRLRLPLMPSLVMDTDMAVDTDMAAMATDVSMVDMAVTDTARGALRLRPMPS